MIDEIHDRHYQAGRAELNAAILAAFARLVRAINNAFEVLHRIEYESPWTSRTKRVRVH